MKNLILIYLYFGLTFGLAGCGKSATELLGLEKVENSNKVESSWSKDQVLKFHFMRRAGYALEVMKSTPDLQTSNEKARALYKDKRALWIKSLEQMATDPNMYIIRDYVLNELGSSPASRVEPAKYPTHVVLASTYLTKESPLDDMRGMALAIHEAGHFATLYPGDEEHKLFDIVAAKLLAGYTYKSKKVSEIQLSTPVLAELPFMLSTDGHVLAVENGRYLLDTQTGLLFETEVADYKKMLTRNHLVVGPYVWPSSTTDLYYNVVDMLTGRVFEMHSGDLEVKQIGFDDIDGYVRFASNDQIANVTSQSGQDNFKDDYYGNKDRTNLFANWQLTNDLSMQYYIHESFVEIKHSDINYCEKQCKENQGLYDSFETTSPATKLELRLATRRAYIETAGRVVFIRDFLNQKTLKTFRDTTLSDVDEAGDRAVLRNSSNTFLVNANQEVVNLPKSNFVFVKQEPRYLLGRDAGMLTVYDSVTNKVIWSKNTRYVRAEAFKTASKLSVVVFETASKVYLENIDIPEAP